MTESDNVPFFWGGKGLPSLLPLRPALNVPMDSRLDIAGPCGHCLSRKGGRKAEVFLCKSREAPVKLCYLQADMQRWKEESRGHPTPENEAVLRAGQK